MSETERRLERVLTEVLDTYSPWYWPWKEDGKRYQCRECGGEGETALSVKHADNCTLGAAQAVLTALDAETALPDCSCGWCGRNWAEVE